MKNWCIRMEGVNTRNGASLVEKCEAPSLKVGDIFTMAESLCTYRNPARRWYAPWRPRWIKGPSTFRVVSVEELGG